MDSTYLFYDIETTGLNKAFDQVLQFAAIRTDQDLNELSRHEIWLKLNPDVVPSPRAFLTHRIPLGALNDVPSECDGIKQIHQLLNTPGTISLGYNTLRFDDEFLRFAFFRNLLTPLTHQYANGCSRCDIYPITVMYYLFKHEAIKWPMIDNKISMKLEHINTENQFITGNAHNAIVDVEVTLALARELKKHDDMWHYLIDYFDKEKDHQRIAKLTSAFTIEHHEFKEGIMVDGIFGFNSQYQSRVICLGRHNNYKNQSLWLRLDSCEFADIEPNQLHEKLWVVKKKPAEPGLLLPTIPRFLMHINEERQQLVERNLTWIKNNTPAFQKMINYHREYTHPKIDHIDADAALYQMGFLLPHENQLCQKFHTRTPAGQVTMLDEFHNPILREQAIRIIGRQDKSRLKGSALDEFEHYLSSVQEAAASGPFDYTGKPRLSPQAALDEIQTIQTSEKLDAEQTQLLETLQAYLSEHFELTSAVS